MDRSALHSFDKEALIRLILAQAEVIERLTKRVAQLEAELGLPKKTPDNSSTPPSKGQKGSVANFLSRVGWGYDRRTWGRRNSAMIDFKGSHFERDVILWGVRWYVAYPMSYRQLERTRFIMLTFSSY